MNFGVPVPRKKQLVHSVLEMQTDRSIVLDVYVILDFEVTREKKV